MFAIVTWSRALLVALALALCTPSASAVSRPTATHPTSLRARSPRIGNPQGSPEFGVLIIIGAVGFLIVVAWLIARVGDDRSRGDSNLN